MSEIKDFMPLTPQLGIAGSSYLIEMGLVNDFWAIRLVKGKSVLDSKVYKDSKDLPNANILTGWVLSVMVLPNVNTYQIQKTVGYIHQKARQNKEDFERKKKSAGKNERNDVVLEKTPEKLKKRVASKGVIVDKEGEEGKISAAELSPTLAASNRAAAKKDGDESATVVVGNRELKRIPTGEGYQPNPNPYGNKVAKSSKVSSSPSKTTTQPASVDSGLLKRITALEKAVEDLKEENSGMKRQIMMLRKKVA